MMLETQGLARSFGGLKAVADVSIQVAEKSIHSVIGPNGAGKTTLFNLITGAIRSDAGTVRFQERDVSGWTPERLAHTGLVRTFQRTSIFKSASVAENVELAIRSREGKNYALSLATEKTSSIHDEAASLLRQVGLLEKRRVQAGTLAHGSQRALDIAIGLALRPKLVLMDEPLAGMSRGDRHQIVELIMRLRESFGLTIVLVEHDIGMVMKISDTITVMQYGKVIAVGAPLQIRDNPEVKKAYLHGNFAE